MKSYSKLMLLDSFEDRFDYLKIHGTVGENLPLRCRTVMQDFYRRSSDWKDFREKILIRDGFFDLAHPGHPIRSYMTIHHINPITYLDVINLTDRLFDPENVITTSGLTHKAIHYGSIETANRAYPVERFENDTCPWKKGVKNEKKRLSR